MLICDEGKIFDKHGNVYKFKKIYALELVAYNGNVCNNDIPSPMIECSSLIADKLNKIRV